MVKRDASVDRDLTFRGAHTLVEMMVVLAMIGFVSAIAFYAIGSFKRDEPVSAAQRQFVADLRLLQNKVNNGVDGDLFKEVEIDPGSNTYKIDGNDVKLPNGVTMSIVGSNPQTFWFCFANPNFLSSFPEGYLGGGPQDACGKNVCAVFGAGIYFACRFGGGPPQIPTGTITVRFTNGSFDQDVVVEGNDMNIYRIYAQ